ncbi:hypothetical protein AU198_18325, partial [Mycobacterium sp. GA-1199]
MISANGEVRSGAQTSENDAQQKPKDDLTEATVTNGTADEESGLSTQPAPPQILEPLISEPLPEAAPKRSQSEAVTTANDNGKPLGAVAMSIEPPSSFTSFNDPPARIAVPVVNSMPLPGARIEPVVSSLAHSVPASGSIVVGAPPTTPAEPASVVTRVLATLLNPFSSNSPGVPVNSPVMWALAAAATRRFGAGPDAPEAETFKRDDVDNSLMLAASAANSAPTVEVVPSPPTKTGVVKGQLIANDPEGDRLTYTGSTTTAKGSVVVDRRGRFTYTPTTIARHNAAAPDAETTGAGEDSFTLTVDDGQGNSVQVPIVVTVTPVNSAPTNGAVSLGKPNPATGEVTGTLTARDRDGDDLSFSGPVTTSKGSITYNSANDSFTYTPTLEARQAASVPRAAKTAKTDTFTVTVSDGYGGTGTITVKVAIAPIAPNQPPTVTTSSGATSYTEQAGPTAIDTGLTLADADNTTLSGATVSIGSPNSAETLDFTAPAGSGITGSYNNTTGVLTLNGASSVANYQTALRSVTYHNASDTPAATRTVSFTVTDGTTPSTAATKTVTITAVNDAPTVTTSSGTTSYTDQAAPAAIDNGLTLADPDNTTLSGATVSIGNPDSTETLDFTAPAGSNITGSYNNVTGVLTLTGASSVANYQTALRSVTYHNTTAAVGTTRSIAFTVNDGGLPSGTSTKEIAIVAHNDAPVAGTPVVETDINTGVVTGSVPFTDPDGDILSYTVAPALRGSIAIDPSTGAFTYTPSQAARQRAAATDATLAEMQDTVVVLADDGKGGITATGITVSVVPVSNATNNAPVAGTPTVGTPSTNSGTVRGSAIFTDPDNDSLRYNIVSSPGKGIVSVDPTTGAFTYTPVANAFVDYRHMAAADTATADDKIDSFTIRASDMRGGTEDVVITVTVSPANKAPTPNPTTVGTADSSGEVAGSVSFFDGNGDNQTYTASIPTKGSVIIDSTGSFIYTPTATARQQAASPTATAADMVDTFVITANDGHGGVTPVTVTVAVLPTGATPNAAPFRNGSGATLTTRSSATGQTTGTVSFSDPNSDVLTYTANQPTKGSLTVDPTTGAFTYTPTAAARHAATAAGATKEDTHDTFTIIASDGRGNATPVVVTVPVGQQNSKPVASTTTVGTPDASTGVVTGQVTASDPDNDTITYIGPTITAKGSLTVDRETGAFTFTPAASARAYAAAGDAVDADLSDTFTITAYDSHGDYVSTVVTVAIQPSTAPNLPPIQTAPTTIGTPDPITGEVSGHFNIADLDRDGISYTFEPIGGSRPTDGFFEIEDGRFTVDGTTGAWTFVPTDERRHEAALETGGRPDVFSFRWTATDARGATISGDVSVPITPANQGPIQSVTTQTVHTATGQTTGTFTVHDADGDYVDVSIVSPPSHGTATVEWIGGSKYQWTYTPAEDQPVGYTPGFTMQLADGHTGRGFDVVTVNPNAQATAAAVKKTGLASNRPTDPATGAIQGTITVPDSAGRTLTYSASNLSNGSVTIDASTGAYTFTPTVSARQDAAAANAPDTSLTGGFTVTVTDGDETLAVIPVTVPISPLNRRPIIEITQEAPDQADGVIRGRVTGTDPDFEELNYHGGATSRLGGAVTISSDGAFSYRPSAAVRVLAAKEPDVRDYFFVGVTEPDGRTTWVRVAVDVHPLNIPGAPPPPPPPPPRHA